MDEQTKADDQRIITEKMKQGAFPPSLSSGWTGPILETANGQYRDILELEAHQD